MGTAEWEAVLERLSALEAGAEESRQKFGDIERKVRDTAELMGEQVRHPTPPDAHRRAGPREG